MSKKNKAEEKTDTTPPVPPPTSDPVLTSDDVTTPGTAAPSEVEAAPEPPAWTPSPDHYLPPPWVIAAQRTAWKVKSVEKPKGEQRAQWTSADIEYTYFKGGDVVARFRADGLYGALKVEPVAEFEKDPEPEVPVEQPTG